MTDTGYTLEGFARLVRDCREMQRQFMHTGDVLWLDESRRLEDKVDRAVREVLEPQTRLLFEDE